MSSLFLSQSRFTLPVTPVEYAADRINRATTLLFVSCHGHTRKDGRTPEVLHPLAVQGLLAQVGVTDDAMHSAALVHDVLEANIGQRGEVLRMQIANSLGSDVLAMVEALTDDTPMDMSRQERKALQRERLKHAPWAVKVIKLADVVASMREGPAPNWTPQQVAQYVQQRSLLVNEVLRPSCAELAYYFNHAVAQAVWQLPLTAHEAGEGGLS